MWVYTLKHFKAGMLLLAATIALSLLWSYLPHLFFYVIVAWSGGIALFFLAFRDSWRQTSRADNTPPRPSRAAPPVRGRRPAAGQARSPRRGRAAQARAQRRGELLGPGATVTLSDERRTAGIDDVFTALDSELVGLLPVKEKVEEIASLLLVDRVRHRFGLDAPRPNLHMCFTGAPGTGKTTVALQMADLLRRLGYLENGHLVHAMRDDLVGEYIGHTAPKTKTCPRTRHGRGFVHRRGVLPVPRHRFKRLRPGVHRYPASGDGE